MNMKRILPLLLSLAMALAPVRLRLAEQLRRRADLRLPAPPAWRTAC